MVVPAEVAATLRDLRLVDTAGERLVFRARSPMTLTAPCWPLGRTTWKSYLATLLRGPTTRRTVAARSGSTKPSQALKDVIDQS